MNQTESIVAEDRYRLLVESTDVSERIMSVTELNDRIRLKTDVDPLRIPSDVVLPLGIIANELLTNSLKHAFPATSRGTILVSLKAVAGREAALTVRDNGIGYDPARADDSTGLGHTLTNTLAQQIHGVVSIESTADGTTVTVQFPLPAANHADA